jgi:hypothetical protein
MKRFYSYAAFVGGIIALVLVLPRFTSSQPRGIRVTRGEARVIADEQARKTGIPVDKAWSSEVWSSSQMLEDVLDRDPVRRRAAAEDPVIAPRLGAYHFTYYRRGQDKIIPYGIVEVSPITGEVLAARRRLRNEEPGAQKTEEALRPKADAFVHSRRFPGALSPRFESARPVIFRSRTDWIFRYRVPSTFPTANVVPYLYVFFAGDQIAGWDLWEEYSDGSSYSGNEGSDLAGAFVQFIMIFSVLLVLLIIFLKKYHAGEVGVETASLLFALVMIVSIAIGLLTGAANADGSNMGEVPAQQTAWAVVGFKFLFYDLPIATMVFLAWAVGESYARERWGERLASFDAILRRDPVNAAVGRSLLNGVLAAPAVAASALLVGVVPLLVGLAHPTIGSGSRIILGSGAAGGLLSCILHAIVYPTVAVLFVLAFSRSRRALPLGIVAALLLGTVGGTFHLPIQPIHHQFLFGFGGIAAIVAVFLAYDLLTSAVALFFGALIVGFAPLLSVARGELGTQLALVTTVPLLLVLLFAAAGLMTKREVTYQYEDLAPHVKRIVERERVKAEIDAANRIQAALLPLESPSLAGATFASHYRAATEIGGDYFDFLALPTGEIGIAFGDVSGHGLTSGIVMAMAKAALLVQVDVDPTPKVVMNVLNEIVIKTAPKRIMMTFFFGLLEPQSQTLRFSSAGHLDPYVYRAGKERLEPLSSWGFPLGVRRREPFREHTVEFSAGDRIILYSDGLIEAVDDDGEPFGFDRFEQTILACGDQSAEEIKRSLLSSVKKFTRNRPPEDDQTLVVVSFEEVGSAALRVLPVTAYSDHVN